MKSSYLPGLCSVEQITKYVATTIKVKDVLPEMIRSRTSYHKLLVSPCRKLAWSVVCCTLIYQTLARA